MFSSLLGSACDLSVEDDGESGCLVSIDIATDGCRRVALLCGMDEIDLGGVIVFEFSFSIAVVADDDTYEPFETQDRNVASPYIPADARPLIMPLVCSALEALVLHVRPAHVYRVAKDRSAASEKALRKHHMLTSKLQSLGYGISDQGTDRHGRRFCTMQRT